MKKRAIKTKKESKMVLKTAMFGAGCFWGVEEAFRSVPGVVSTEVGYAGGSVKDVSYQQVCSGDTGHAEVVRIIYNNKKISYKSLLNIFWKIHNPTQMNRQGPDFGTQYRSVIFYFDSSQKKEAEKLLNDEQKKLARIIATVIEKAGIYVKAEDYHQKYVMKTGRNVC